jgi:hypothetical protein
MELMVRSMTGFNNHSHLAIGGGEVYSVSVGSGIADANYTQRKVLNMLMVLKGMSA